MPEHRGSQGYYAMFAVSSQARKGGAEMRIAVVIEARDGDGPINTIKLAEEVLPEISSIKGVMEQLKLSKRFVDAMRKTSVALYEAALETAE
jgi:hypothetical protein